jgi:hypothetical protein
MPTNKLSKSDQIFLKNLGQRVRKIILTDKGYSSLDAFSLEYYDVIAKPTLYQLCDGKRDMKLSTLRSLSKAIGLSIEDLLAGL